MTINFPVPPAIHLLQSLLQRSEERHRERQANGESSASSSSNEDGDDEGEGGAAGGGARKDGDGKDVKRKKKCKLNDFGVCTKGTKTTGTKNYRHTELKNFFFNLKKIKKSYVWGGNKKKSYVWKVALIHAAVS